MVAYTIIMMAVILSIVITPLIFRSDESLAKISYNIYAPTCHQITQRSLCVFYQGDEISKIDNCLSEETPIYIKSIAVEYGDGSVGYKFPVCSRCLAIYVGMVLGVAFYLIQKDKTKFPNILIFVILIAPLALDGTLQLIGLHQSNNLLRIITGLIAGGAVPVYLLPMLSKISSVFLSKFTNELKIK
ncbi:DUF2085 domain-containing protein [Candidatus Micrarchaeota archaeon]|nr:DUF2085 domain-containing protein [Candidatus Micrarchaeota archaeon]